MAFNEACKRELEIEIPITEVAKEKERAAEKIRAKVNLKGFRPGKAPISMILKLYETSIRDEVVESLLPRFFNQRAEAEQLNVVGTPNVTHIDFEEGMPIKFKAEFEVAPEIELKEYRGLTVTYEEPVVTDRDVEQQLEDLREGKAEYVNLDPRPAELGDVAVVAMESIGLEEPMTLNEMKVELGSPDTMAAFTDNITGMSPGQQKVFAVTYPDDYGEERLAGQTVEFQVHLKLLQEKELPELNDEFAKDLGDFQSIEELKDTIRKSIFREKEAAAQRAAKDEAVARLVEMHDFPVPEAYVDRQTEIYIEQFLAGLAGRGAAKKVRPDRDKVKEAMRGRAESEIKASLLLERIADREAISVLKDEVDQEMIRFAKQNREPVAAVRKRFDENGTTARIANAIRTGKTLAFLFENARKESPKQE